MSMENGDYPAVIESSSNGYIWDEADGGAAGNFTRSLRAGDAVLTMWKREQATISAMMQWKAWMNEQKRKGAR